MSKEGSYEWQGKRSLLLVAHPGHELLIHHWLESSHPLVLVLTDGSGHTTHSRLASTTNVLQEAHAKTGSIYGALSDKALYEAILAPEKQIFLDLMTEIANILRREEIDYVVGDAVEGANPGHDVCRLMLNAAILKLKLGGNDRIRNFEFMLEEAPAARAVGRMKDGFKLRLDDGAFGRKIVAAQNYPEIRADMERTLNIHGPELFRQEYFYPVSYALEIEQLFSHPPLYERYGAKQVTAGLYQSVIRFKEHVEPLAKSLEAAVRAV